MQNKSFTLIELLVVIVIIGILAGVIIVSVSSSISKANFAKAQAFSNTVQNELLGDLVSEWTFDNPSLPGEDTWGNNDGIVSGATHKTKADRVCVYGGCMSFDGNDYIDFGSGINIIDKTIQIWIKTNNTTMGLIGQNGGTGQWILAIRDNAISWDTWATGLDMNENVYIKDNNWHQLVVVISDTNNKTIFYVDGDLKKQDNSSVSTPAASQNLYIGSCSMVAGTWCDGRYNSYNGLIDDVRIYNEALSTSQIKQEYVAGLNSLLANNNISKEEYKQRLNALSYAE